MKIKYLAKFKTIDSKIVSMEYKYEQAYFLALFNLLYINENNRKIVKNEIQIKRKEIKF